MQAIRIVGLGIGLCILLGMQTVAARTVTQGFGGSNDDGCETQTLTFEQAHLGPGETLTSVSMSLDASMEYASSPHPDSTQTSVSFSVGVMVNGPGIPVKGVCQTFDFDLLKTVHVDVGAGNIEDVGNADVSPTSGVSAYIGAGTVDVFVSSDTDDSCGDVHCFLIVRWGVGLTYDIAEGPRIVEPSSISLLGFGAGLVCLGWRRHRGVVVLSR